MGLDLVVEGCPRPGHEAEWRRLMERAFADLEMSDAEAARFNEISIPAFEHIGAPRVGADAAADAWIIAGQKAETPQAVAATLKEFSGYHVVALVKCDGVPAYSHGGLYDGVDETSFRGAFLQGCTQVLDTPMIDAAWEHKLPETAIAYGRALLAAADTAEESPLQARRKLRDLFSAKKAAETFPLAEQLDIVRSAGRWFVFWGERGHAIRAYF